MKKAALLWILLFAVVVPSRSLAFADLLVQDVYRHMVLRYDGQTGAFKETFVSAGGTAYWTGSAGTGPDGHFYISISGWNQIQRYNGTTGQFLDVFIGPGIGGLAGPVGGLWRERKLYVANEGTNTILRYDQNGAFLGTFTSGGPLSGPRSPVFGPDGDLYVLSWNNYALLRYDGVTGAFKSVVASFFGSAGSMTFGTDGHLYVTNGGRIWRINVTTSALTEFINLGPGGNALGVAFGPDQNLYVSLWGGGVKRFSGSNGTLLGQFIPVGSGGLTEAGALRFVAGK